MLFCRKSTTHCIIVRYLSNVILLGTIVLSLVCFELKFVIMIELNTRVVNKLEGGSFWLICVGFTAAARLDVIK